MPLGSRLPWRRGSRGGTAQTTAAQTVAASETGVVQQVNLHDVRAGGDVNINVLFAASVEADADIAEALIGDPLRLAGVDGDIERARQLRAAGDHVAAGDLLVQAAAALEARGFGLIGEFSLAEAAEAFSEGGDRPRAAELLEEVVDRRLDRYDSRAEHDAYRLARLLDKDDQWRAQAYLARALWPEQPDAAVAALTEAVAKNAGHPDELIWGAVLVGVLVTLGRNEEAVTNAKDIQARWPLEPGELTATRLGLELDYLDARLEVEGMTAELDVAWNELIVLVEGRQPALEESLMARLHQRRGVALARSDRPTDARGAFVRAIKEWNRRDGNEEQIKETFFSLERADLLSGNWRGDTQQVRVYASRLRGGDGSAATAAERLERQGLHSRLSSEFPDALRAYWQAYAVSREAGNLSEQLAAGERLAELYLTVSRPAEALRFLIASGKEKEAKEVAAELAPQVALAATRLRGPVWERTVSYAILEVIGDRLTDAQYAELVPDLIEAARPTPTGIMWPQPSLRARAALATVAVGVPDDLLPTVIGLLEAERRTPNADVAISALLRLTNLGRVDETERVAEIVFDEGTVMRSPSAYFIWLGERLHTYPELAERIATSAGAGHHGALEALAVADRVGDDPQLVAVIDRQVEAFLAHRGYEERIEDGQTVRTIHIGDNSAVGITARYCSAHLRERLVARLLEIVVDDNEGEMNRASAADALYNFAGRVAPATAAAALPPLLRVARGEHGQSALEGQTGPRDPLARYWVSWNTTGALRASALTAAARIAGAAELDVDALHAIGVEHALRLALESAEADLIRAALVAYCWLPTLQLPLTFADAFSHPDAKVRVSAIALFRQREELPPVSELAVLARADPDANVRTQFSFLAAGLGVVGRPLAEALADDERVFTRRHAQAQLTIA